MAEIFPGLDPEGFTFEAVARHPSALVLVAANLVPLFGALFWGWGVADLLFAYWAESAVIGFYNAAKILFTAQKIGAAATGVGLTAFFCVHYGGFMLGHAAFLVAFFGFPRPDLGLLAFWAALFASHGFSFFYNFLGQKEYEIAAGTRGGESAETAPAGGMRILSELMMRPYARIVLMHVTIIFGGLLFSVFGAPQVVLALLVVLKTAVDLAAHVAERNKYAQ
ncbi:MAG: DUF6498-containing protein [Candidatus Micrarchaeia archaeon]|jgi:hypothetical protein